MGIVAKQSIYTSLGSYLGVALGALNTMILFPRLFKNDPAFVGEVSLILNTALLVAAFVHLGAPVTVSSFFHRFSVTIQSKYFTAIVIVIFLLSLVGFGAIAILWALGERTFSQSMILTIGLCISYFEILASVAQHYQKVVWPSLIRSTFRRLILLVAILTTFFLNAGAAFFYSLLIGGYLLQVLFVLPYLKHYSIGWKLPQKRDFRFLKPLFKYGIVSVLGAGALLLVSRLDIIMISLLINKANVAFYVIAYFLGSAVSIPTKSSLYNLRPHIAKVWHAGNGAKVDEMYKENATVQFFITGVLLVFLWNNMGLIYQLVPESYRVSPQITLIIGLTELFIVGTSFNGIILALGRKQKQNLILTLSLVGLVVVLNYWLIPKAGLLGAALSSLLALVLYNVVKSLLVYRYFKMSALSVDFIRGAFLILVLLGLISYLQTFETPEIIYYILSNLVLIILLVSYVWRQKGLQTLKSLLQKMILK